jgi:hypothetical protein
MLVRVNAHFIEDSMSEVLPLFPTPVYISHTDIKPEWKELIKQLDFHRFPSNDGWCTDDPYVLELPELTDLKQIILTEAYNYVFNSMGYSRENIEFYITNSWVTKHDVGDSSGFHNHVNSLVSGTCYIDVPEGDGGEFIVGSPNKGNVFPEVIDIDSDFWTIHNSKSWTLSPKTGNIFMFPSHVGHSVLPSSKGERYCLAYNMFAKGKLGSGIKDNIGTLELK